MKVGRESSVSSPPVLEARNVTKEFSVRGRGGRGQTVHAVDDVSLQLFRGSIVALVGESGSGKTTVARLLSLYYPASDGEILLNGKPIHAAHRRAAREYYGQVQLLFQDPFASLNSLHSVRHILGRALRIHRRARGRAEVESRIVELLERVNLHPAREFINKYPHEMSGGQRQRIVIARALAVGPQVMLGDEPISMLDVSIRLDILNLLTKLREEEGMAMLYITHDIASARYIADEIKVMYAGQMVESGPSEEVIHHPAHPYTDLLLQSSPNPEKIGASREELFADAGDAGEPPSLITPPSGCRFHPRCPYALDICSTKQPPRFSAGPGHWAQCWLLDESVTDPRSANRSTDQPQIAVHRLPTSTEGSSSA